MPKSQHSRRADSPSLDDIKAEVVSRLGAAGLRTAYESLGVVFTGSRPSASGALECYAFGREDPSRSSPSACVFVATGRYHDSGGGQGVSLWDFDAENSGKHGDWLGALKYYAEFVGVNWPQAGSKSSGRKNRRKKSGGDAADQANQPAGNQASSSSAEPKLLSDTVTLNCLNRWVRFKRGLTVASCQRAGGRACAWVSPAGERILCIKFDAYQPSDWTKPTAGILYRVDGRPFFEGTRYERKTHTLSGSRDSILLVGGPAELAAATTIIKCEGPTDAIALDAHLPAGGDGSRQYVAITNTSGCGSFPESLAVVGAGKRIIIVHDADLAGEQGLSKVAAQFQKLPDAKSIEQLTLPYDIAKKHGKDLRDYFNEGNSFAALIATAKPATIGPLEIDSSCQELRVITQLAWDAIEQANEPPRLFSWANKPIRLERGDDNEPLLQQIDDYRLRHEAARSASWVKKIQAEDGGAITVPAMPPMAVIKDMLAAPAIPLPSLQRVVEAPVFAADGTLQTDPGYHPASRTYFSAAPEFIIPPVSTHPSADELADARETILDILHDFPFLEDADRTHAVAAMLLGFARDLIRGPTPLHLFEKPSPGTGASLLVDAIVHPFTGRCVSAMTEGRDDDEWRKKLTSIFRKGPAFIFIDNLRGRLDSAALASAMTATYWEDRVLGASEIIRLPVRSTWMATGNNPTVSTEISRRTISIRLDAKIDQPWLRDSNQFRHPCLRTHLENHRGKIVWACLTLIRSWLAAGNPGPAGGLHLGMFESWSRVIGGILTHANFSGFLGNLSRLYADNDEEGSSMRAFICAWWGKFGHRPIKSADILDCASDTLGARLGDGADRSRLIRLGKILSQNRDRIFAVEIEGENSVEKLQICKAGKDHQAILWQLLIWVGEGDGVRGVSQKETIPSQHHLIPDTYDETGRIGEEGSLPHTHTHTRTHTRARDRVERPENPPPHSPPSPQPESQHYDYDYGNLSDDEKNQLDGFLNS